MLPAGHWEHPEDGKSHHSKPSLTALELLESKQGARGGQSCHISMGRSKNSTLQTLWGWEKSTFQTALELLESKQGVWGDQSCDISMEISQNFSLQARRGQCWCPGVLSGF